MGRFVSGSALAAENHLKQPGIVWARSFTFEKVSVLPRICWTGVHSDFKTGKSYPRGRLSTVDLLVPTS
jgi:hypothetical protein